WCMLNPSKADHRIDDPTIRKCVGFTKSKHYGGLVVTNLFAYRATDPRELTPEVARFDPRNLEAIVAASKRCYISVAAWGGSVPKTADAQRMIDAVLELARSSNRWACFGRTKSGEPRHPLMLAYDTPWEWWPDSSGGIRFFNQIVVPAE